MANETHPQPACVCQRGPSRSQPHWRVLDGGQGGVWQFSRLVQLLKQTDRAVRYCKWIKDLEEKRNDAPQIQRSALRRWREALPRAGRWHRSRHTLLVWSDEARAGWWCECPGAKRPPGCDETWSSGLRITEGHSLQELGDLHSQKTFFLDMVQPFDDIWHQFGGSDILFFERN